MAPRSRSYQLSASPVTVLAHLLFIAVTTLVLVWLLDKREGLAFKSDNKFKIFNWILGFFSYVFPGAEMGTRASYLPWHTFLGIVILFLAICTAEMGLLQKFLQLGLFRNQEALIVNFTGLLILLFGISVGLTVVLPRSY
ncbi:hypothetical protein EZV62_018429 [Acer yangbiense]|uniref:Cytochrome b561 domain-containing protein n=1 Tax=Acer yangbiense TaxID=1000413 RepID=A0A5C7HLH9_9ROSI|nr:hypothetical protein EZV62_018429 [Acer yangbiense]